MSTKEQALETGCYRLARDVRLVRQGQGGWVICRYPLRIVRVGMMALRLLELCLEQRRCEELAERMDVSVGQVGKLCEQLRWKGLLGAGPMVPPAVWPEVSIIVPSYNRAGQLARCLRSLCTVDYPASCLEIVVVDDASSDETAGMLDALRREMEGEGRMLRVVRHARRQGVARSRNTGAEAAQYELLAYVDSDCVVSAGWLKALVPTFQQARVGAVGGMIRAYEKRSTLGRYEDVCSSLFMGLQEQRVRREGPLTYLPTANLLLRRGLWQSLGGFAAMTFGEDVDFCRRLLASGAEIWYLPEGVVYHDYCTEVGAFLKVRAAYASSEAALMMRHPNERRVLLLPPEQALFAGLVLGGVWSLIHSSAVGQRFKRGEEDCRQG